MLQEKDDKKKQQIEEKECRRREREEKKKIREQEAQRKKEEKARKAEEKAKNARQKSTRKRTSLGTSQASNKRQKKSVVPEPSDSATGDTIQEQNPTAETSSSSTCGTVQTTATASTGDMPTQKETTIGDFDVNVCCMCFGTYQDDVLEGCGAEWITCTCGRWLHVECAEDHVVDCSSNGLYCPYCIDGLTGLTL